MSKAEDDHIQRVSFAGPDPEEKAMYALVAADCQNALEGGHSYIVSYTARRLATDLMNYSADFALVNQDSTEHRLLIQCCDTWLLTPEIHAIRWRLSQSVELSETRLAG